MQGENKKCSFAEKKLNFIIIVYLLISKKYMKTIYAKTNTTICEIVDISGKNRKKYHTVSIPTALDLTIS